MAGAAGKRDTRGLSVFVHEFAVLEARLEAHLNTDLSERSQDLDFLQYYRRELRKCYREFGKVGSTIVYKLRGCALEKEQHSARIDDIDRRVRRKRDDLNAIFWDMGILTGDSVWGADDTISSSFTGNSDIEFHSTLDPTLMENHSSEPLGRTPPQLNENRRGGAHCEQLINVTTSPGPYVLSSNVLRNETPENLVPSPNLFRNGTPENFIRSPNFISGQSPASPVQSPDNSPGYFNVSPVVCDSSSLSGAPGIPSAPNLTCSQTNINPQVRNSSARVGSLGLGNQSLDKLRTQVPCDAQGLGVKPKTSTYDTPTSMYSSHLGVGALSDKPIGDQLLSVQGRLGQHPGSANDDQYTAETGVPKRGEECTILPYGSHRQTGE